MLNIKIKINENANNLILMLQNAGFKAYIVGGCVRDSILKREPKDWDICTSATTEQMREVFKDFKIIATGEKHGTLTVMVNNEAFEVTTFRKDGEYTDSRHPDNVEFISDIKEDLARRDFTINAIAYNDKEGLIDPFNGYDDINNKTIRCVGEPHKRFKEDALRILRALRFSATYGFNIERNTEIEMYNIVLNGALFNIARERIHDEFVKIVSAPNAFDILKDYYGIFCSFIPYLDKCIGFNQNNKYHCYDVYMHSLHALKNYKGNDKNTKVALFLHDIGKPACYTEDENGGHFYGHPLVSKGYAETILNKLRFSNDDKEEILTLIMYHDVEIADTKRCVRRALNKFGEDILRKIFEMQKADIMAHSIINREHRYNIILKKEQLLNELIEENACFSIKDLAISGKDILNMGIKEGKEVGDILNYVLNAVLEGDKNEKDNLLKIVKEYLTYGKDAF